MAKKTEHGIRRNMTEQSAGCSNFADVNIRMLRSFHLILIALIAIFIFAFEYLPFQDFPILLYQGFVFNQIVFHGNTFGGLFAIQPYLPPNIISMIVFGVTDLILSPLVSGKLYLFFLTIALYSGIASYLRFHIKRDHWSLLVIALILTFNLHYLAGYLNFVTGFAFVMNAIVFIRKRKLQSNILVMTIAIFIAYCCHFFALAIFGAYWIAFFLTSRDYKGLLRCTIAFLPSAVILLHYVIMQDLGGLKADPTPLSLIFWINWKLLVFYTPIIPFHQFKWVSDQPQWLLMANYIFCTAIAIWIVYVLFKLLRARSYSFILWLSIGLLAMTFLLPFFLGGVILPGERLVVFAIMNMIVLTSTLHFGRRMRQALLILICFGGISITAYNIYNFDRFNTMIAMKNIPEEAIKNPVAKREGTNGFLHYHFYDDIKNMRASPIFTTGFLVYKGPDADSAQKR